jgi:hypothetical protein
MLGYWLASENPIFNPICPDMSMRRLSFFDEASCKDWL